MCFPMKSVNCSMYILVFLEYSNSMRDLRDGWGAPGAPGSPRMTRPILHVSGPEHKGPPREGARRAECHALDGPRPPMSACRHPPLYPIDSLIPGGWC